MIPRILETESMDSLAEAVDYDSMDHSEANRAFVADLLAASRGPGWILDLGTGPAQLPIELCCRDPAARVLAVDRSGHMLRLASRNVEQAGLTHRIRLGRADVKELPFRDAAFAVVISNGTLHHLPDPWQLLAEAWRVLAPGALVLIRDLMRPGDDEAVRRLVATYVGDANDHQRRMFDDSFHAALTLEEVRQLVIRLGVSSATAQATSDRHWTWSARKG
jgi:ubiquinone/menaquinone biosynthesis C-methylase UbiE